MKHQNYLTLRFIVYVGFTIPVVVVVVAVETVVVVGIVVAAVVVVVVAGIAETQTVAVVVDSAAAEIAVAFGFAVENAATIENIHIFLVTNIECEKKKKTNNHIWWRKLHARWKTHRWRHAHRWPAWRKHWHSSHTKRHKWHYTTTTTASIASRRRTTKLWHHRRRIW